MFKVGDKIVWVEIKDGDMNKRFMLPAELGIVQKLQALLSTHAGLFLIRNGEGEIKNGGLPSTGKILSSMEHTEDMIYGGNTLYGHPDINQGSLRYSEGFIEAILSQEALVSSISTESYSQQPAPSQTAIAPPPATGGGVDELRARFGGGQPPATDPVVQPVGNTAPPAAPAAPVDPQIERDKQEAQQKLAQQDLRQQLDGRGQIAQQNPVYVYESAPNEVNYVIGGATVKNVEDILVKVTQLLQMSEVPNAGVTGKQLASWFRDSIEIRGYDQTFEFLASKLGSL